MTADVIYYTDNSLKPELQAHCLYTLVCNISKHKSFDIGLICVSQKSMWALEFFNATQIVVGEKTRCLRSMYEQISIGLAASKADVVILAEHDCLYPACRFDPETWSSVATLTYNTNMYWMSHRGFFGINPAPRLSQLYGPRDEVVAGIAGKLDICTRGQRVRWSEPGIEDCMDYVTVDHPDPSIDIRHGRNITGMREASRYMDSVPYWGEFEPLAVKLGLIEEVDCATEDA